MRVGLSAAALPALACGDSTAPPAPPRIQARPGTPTATPVLGAPTLLELGGARDGFYYVPTTYPSDAPIPLMVAFHGAGGSGSVWQQWISRAETRGFAILAPDSRGPTWDAVRTSYGPDVAFLELALAFVFARVHVDPTRVALAGFSDGASYGLSLGIPNGDLFGQHVAFSPGYYDRASPPAGAPRVFVSHGTNDPLLSFGITRDQIIPRLEDDGLDVTFRQFVGGHEVPAAVVDDALEWWIG